MLLLYTKRVKQKIILGLLVILTLFTHFYNLDRTSRFSRDESSDLVTIHQYFVDKKLTLVGPIDSTHTKVFGSLTYYLLMPFTILGNFDPVSPIYGTAFFGLITAAILILLIKQTNKDLL